MRANEPNQQNTRADETAETDAGSGGGVGVPGAGGGGGVRGAGALAGAGIRLIPNWRRAPRMLTMWVGMAATVFGLMPADQQLAVLALFGVAPLQAPAIIGLAFMAARLIDQPKTRAG